MPLIGFHLHLVTFVLIQIMIEGLRHFISQSAIVQNITHIGRASVIYILDIVAHIPCSKQVARAAFVLPHRLEYIIGEIAKL